MQTSIIVFPGSNCDRDMKMALKAITGIEPEMVWHADSEFRETDLITLPGGFSYGDYLRCGAMASKSLIMREVIERAKKGVPVLGVCNGFQILIESGLLPGALIRNSNIKYICKDVTLTITSNNSLFTRNFAVGDTLRLPIAHRDGNYFAEEYVLEKLQNEERIALQYTNEEGVITSDSNPNGSLKNIAGILNEEKNILGMMPHPERLFDAALGGTDGKLFFEGIIKSLS